MAINDEEAKAVQTIKAHTMRHYDHLRGDVESVFIVGAGVQCAEKIEYFFSKGIDTLIIGVADPVPTQLDMFGEKVQPKMRV